MKAIVGEEIVLEDFTPEAEKFFEDKLTFSNPEYYKKVGMGKWAGNTPEKIRLIQRRGNNLIVPYGMLPIVFQNSKQFESIYSRNLCASSGIFDYESEIKTYEYQEEAVQTALRKRQGVIVAPCGSGKTMIGLEIAARIGGRTLWLTHTQDLLNQSKDRALSCFGMSERKFGTITGGKVDIGEAITFATVQTMSKIDLEKVRDCFDVVITDECHHVAGSPTKIMMFWRVISNLSARYKFGLTATPKRSDGLTPCMYALIGPKIYEIGQEEVSGATCPVDVTIRKTHYFPDLDKVLMPDGTLSYSRFINEIVRDRARNDMIVADIAERCGRNETCIVLTDRIEHIEILKRKLDEKGISASSLSAASSKRAKSEREFALYALRQKQTNVLIATYALAKEGLDVQNLDNIIFATPQKNETIVTQSAGRVARKADGKEIGHIIDYEDAFDMLASWQRKRNRIYNKLGFTILEQ